MRVHLDLLRELCGVDEGVAAGVVEPSGRAGFAFLPAVVHARVDVAEVDEAHQFASAVSGRALLGPATTAKHSLRNDPEAQKSKSQACE